MHSCRDHKTLPYYEVNGVHQLFGYPSSFVFTSAEERNSYGFITS